MTYSVLNKPPVAQPPRWVSPSYLPSDTGPGDIPFRVRAPHGGRLSASTALAPWVDGKPSDPEREGAGARCPRFQLQDPRRPVDSAFPSTGACTPHAGHPWPSGRLRSCRGTPS